MSNQKRFALIGSGIGPIDKSDALADGDILVYNAATGKWVSQAFSGTAALTEAVQDVVGAMATDNTDINFTYDDGAGTLVATVIESGVDHDALANFVADEHVAHTGVTLTAGAGLTGGGDISASRSFAVGAGTGITVNADDVALTIPVVVSSGGSGAITLTGLLQGNGTSAFTAITNSSTVGQVLRVTGASTYAWGALDLADSDAITGDLPDANLSDNVPLLNAANVFTATQTLNGAFNWFATQSAGGGFGWHDDANTYIWSSAADTIQVVVGGVNGLLISQAEFQVDATLLDFNGAVDISGTLAVGSFGITLANTGAYRWADDTDTFIYLPGANTLAITAGNADVATFSQSEIDLTATTLDFNGNCDVSGTLTRATNTVWDAGNDGSGSGLDADLLDGQHASEFAAGVSGSFTATLTGMTAATTGTINFEISGGMCTLWFRGSTGITGTSNTTAMTMTGLPAACQPAGAVSAPCGNLISNSSANRAGLGQIAAGGSTITFYVADASALWTATGFAAANLKGVYEGWSMTYALT